MLVFLNLFGDILKLAYFLTKVYLRLAIGPAIPVCSLWSNPSVSRLLRGWPDCLLSFSTSAIDEAKIETADQKAERKVLARKGDFLAS